MAETRGKGLEIVWKRKNKILSKEGKTLLRYDLQIPILRNDQKRFRRINRIYEHTAKVWETRWTGECCTRAERELILFRESSRPFIPWQAGLSGAITRLDERRLSIRMEAEERRGDGRASRVCWGDVWDLETGALCSIDQLTTLDRAEIWSEILRQGREREKSGTCFLDQDWERKAKKLLHRLTPCLTETGLEYDFPQASIAPAAEGILRFTVENTDGDGTEERKHR